MAANLGLDPKKGDKTGSDKGSDKKTKPAPKPDPKPDPDPKTAIDDTKTNNSSRKADYADEMDDYIDVLKAGLDKGAIKELLDGVTSKKDQVKLLKTFKNATDKQAEANAKSEENDDDGEGKIPLGATLPKGDGRMDGFTEIENWSKLTVEPVKSVIKPPHSEGNWEKGDRQPDMAAYLELLGGK